MWRVNKFENLLILLSNYWLQKEYYVALHSSSFSRKKLSSPPVYVMKSFSTNLICFEQNPSPSLKWSCTRNLTCVRICWMTLVKGVSWDLTENVQISKSQFHLKHNLNKVIDQTPPHFPQMYSVFSWIRNWSCFLLWKWVNLNLPYNVTPLQPQRNRAGILFPRQTVRF